jgi:hypothetical protein
MLVKSEVVLELSEVAKGLPGSIEPRRSRVEQIKVSRELTRAALSCIEVMGEQPALPVEEIPLRNIRRLGP